MNKEFESIIEDIVLDPEFQMLKQEIHHGTSRYDHLYKVAKGTYKNAKSKNLDYKSATRAALLHDYFFKSDMKDKRLIERLKTHSDIALDRTKNKYNLNKLEQEIILTHMYPLTKDRSKTKESKIVILEDKKASVEEFFKYKIIYEIKKMFGKDK